MFVENKVVYAVCDLKIIKPFKGQNILFCQGQLLFIFARDVMIQQI